MSLDLSSLLCMLDPSTTNSCGKGLVCRAIPLEIFFGKATVRGANPLQVFWVRVYYVGPFLFCHILLVRVS